MTGSFIQAGDPFPDVSLTGVYHTLFTVPHVPLVALPIFAQSQWLFFIFNASIVGPCTRGITIYKMIEFVSQFPDRLLKIILYTKHEVLLLP